MRRLVLLALCGMAACGDNLLATGDPLAPAGDLVIVAHQDDDLLFMQPDVLEAVRAGGGVTTVYVTAGNGTKGADASDRRYEGLRSAYSAAAGSTAWRCGYVEITGHVAEHCRLTDRPVSLVFLAFPDGGKEGEHTASLLHLWQGTIAGAETVAHRTTYYDRDGLIETVAQIIRITQPSRVRTLEIAATHGRDHSDHMLVGALTVLAMTRASSVAELLSYRGYSIADEPTNKVQPIYDESFEVLAHYEACVADCAACGDAC
ncbi:MAG TPA: PIG-L family deacetylase, partial [Kofleriaceae bacterium]|nr:PIG-L family deacetylase [Kofleriaceae bacterium]